MLLPTFEPATLALALSPPTRRRLAAPLRRASVLLAGVFWPPWFAGVVAPASPPGALARSPPCASVCLCCLLRVPAVRCGRVALRRTKGAKIGRQHRITRGEGVKWFETKFEGTINNKPN